MESPFWANGQVAKPQGSVPVELAFADNGVEPPEPPRSSVMNSGPAPDADM
jgi:hypothetical protein